MPSSTPTWAGLARTLKENSHDRRERSTHPPVCCQPAPGDPGQKLRDILRLDVGAAQKSFVAPNPISIAQAHFYPEKAWFRAIYADETPVGFVMLSDDTLKPEYFLWRLMIDAKYQGLGFGRRAVDRVIDYVRTRPGATHLLVSCVPGEGSPCPFYEKLGFVATGEIDDGEHVYRLNLVAEGEDPPAPPLADLPPEAAQFDFWMGDWDVRVGRRPGPQPDPQESLDGRVVLESFDGSPGMNLRGTSVSVFDVGLGKWRQTWVDNQGSYLDLTGGWEADAPDGPRMVWTMQRTVNDKPVQLRMVFANITADAFDWRWQSSEDGATWQDRWAIRYSRP